MIDTEALRKKVIDLAIQGKLTEQLPSDGDAETLYAQIQEEKAKLIKEGKIKKDKVLPSISDDEIPFEIPKNWKWVRLGETTFIERGGSPRPIKSYITDSEDGINWIKIGDVEKGGKYIYSTKEKIIPEGEKKSRHVYPGDFLLTNSMSFGRPYISKVEGCIHDGWLLIRDLKGFSDDYLYYLLSSTYMYGQFCNKASGATVDNLNIDKVNSALIPLAPMAEQKRIAKVIDNVFILIKKIDTLQQQYESNLSVLKGKIIDAGIRGKLTEQLPEDGDAETLYLQIQEEKAKLIKEGKIKKEKPLPEIDADEIPFEIPMNWKWVKLGDVARIYGGKRIPAGRSLTTEDTGHKYIRVSDMKNGTVITDNLLFVPEDIYPIISRYIIKKEDIYITVAGTIGKVGRIPAEIDGSNLTENADRIVFNFMNQDWLLRCLSASMIQKQIEKLTTQVAQPKLSLKRIQEFVIPMPPLEEQKRISAIISKVLSEL